MNEKRSREEYERGLAGYHDPTSGFGGSTPARSALTLRLWLAGFGAVFCAVAAVLSWRADLTGIAIVLAVLTVVSLIDLVWVAHRKRRGEPG
jgi:Flp pilus assembly protein TadB